MWYLHGIMVCVVWNGRGAVQFGMEHRYLILTTRVIVTGHIYLMTRYDMLCRIQISLAYTVLTLLYILFPLAPRTLYSVQGVRLSQPQVLIE